MEQIDLELTSGQNLQKKDLGSLLKSRKKLRERFQADFPLGVEKKQYSEMDEKFMSNLLALIADNISNQDFGVDEMYKELGINRNLLFTKIRALTDQSPADLLKSIRLKIA